MGNTKKEDASCQQYLLALHVPDTAAAIILSTLHSMEFVLAAAASVKPLPRMVASKCALLVKLTVHLSLKYILGFCKIKFSLLFSESYFWQRGQEALFYISIYSSIIYINKTHKETGMIRQPM